MEPALLCATAIGFASIVIVGLLLRYFGRVVGRATETNARVSLRDFMSLTVASAVLLGSLQPSADLLRTEPDWDFVKYMIVPIALSPIGLALGFSQNRRLFAAALGFTVIAVSLVVGCRTLELWFGNSLARLGETIVRPTIPITQANAAEIFQTHRLIEAALTALCAPFLATIPLRLRGWRLKKWGQVSFS